jgi:hypothetical protein
VLAEPLRVSGFDVIKSSGDFLNDRRAHHGNAASNGETRVVEDFVAMPFLEGSSEEKAIEAAKVTLMA